MRQRSACWPAAQLCLRPQQALSPALPERRCHAVDQDVPAESIEAGSYTANMLLGSSQQLSPVVRPRNSTDSVVFISDDTSILTVSNSGVVQAVGVGTTRITAAAGNQICAYTIVVSMDSSMIVTEMDLSLSSNTIYVATRSRHSCRCGLLRLPTMPPSP